MSSLDEQKEFIKDEFLECVEFASKIIGINCCDTLTIGDPEKEGEDKSTKFVITPDPYSTDKIEDRNNLLAFEKYFYEHYGKWKDRCYFDTPYEAFFNIIKAWQIWKNNIPPHIKGEYLKRAKKE